MKTILYVATRFPWPIDSGRKLMIAQSLSLSCNIGDTHLIYYDTHDQHTKTTKVPELSSIQFAKNPSAPAIISDLIFHPLAPLQTHLFGGKTAFEALDKAVVSIKPDIVVFDMLRTYRLAKKLRKKYPNLPFLLDVDDHLSERYNRMLRNNNTNVLGAVGAQLPKVIQGLAKFLPSIILRLEAYLMRNAENNIPVLYDSAIAVSAKEASNLIAGDTTFNIRGIPPILEKTKSKKIKTFKKKRFVFVGNSNHYGNFEALNELDNIAAVVLDACDSKNRPEFLFAGVQNPKLDMKHVKSLGFVPDLEEFLENDSILVMPLRTGSGIKTKILHAIANGVPVISTNVGVESLDLQDREHFFLCEDNKEFCKMLIDIAKAKVTGAELAEMANRAMAKLEKQCNRALVQKDFIAAFDDAMLRSKK